MSDVPTLSTGQPSTLKVWHALSDSVFGTDSKATLFLAAKMAEQGEDEPVLADEGQMLRLLMQLAAPA